MPFTKATAAKAGAKSKRGPNKISPKMQEFMNYKGSDKALKILNSLEGEEYLDAFFKMAPFIWPKLASAQIEAKADINIQIKEPDFSDD